MQPERLAEARGYLDRISLQWDEALGRLKDFVENDREGLAPRRQGRTG